MQDIHTAPLLSRNRLDYYGLVLGHKPRELLGGAGVNLKPRAFDEILEDAIEMAFVFEDFAFLFVVVLS